jgi:hypothetical protein
MNQVRRISTILASFISILFIGAGAASGAPLPAPPQTPAQVVEEYCQLDLKGARLSSDNPYVEKYFSLVTWEDEAGYDGADVAKECRVLSSKVSGGRAEVTTEYKILGTIEANTVRRSPRTERVTFVLEKSGGKWKITRPLLPPHVSPSSLIANYWDLLKREQDQAYRKTYEKMIAKLEAIDAK